MATLAAPPQISICMPVYNGAWCLREAVGSVLAQTCGDFELLVFDDGSTDESWPILESFRDPRIALHRNPRNLGAEGNWNQALNAAKGKYIKLFHQDDLLDPECVARQMAALESHPEAAFAFCPRQIIGPDGAPLLRRRSPWREGLVGREEVARRCVSSGTNLIGEPSAVLIRASAAKAAGPFDGSIPYLIDLDYWMRLLKVGGAYHVDAPLASFRVSRRQWSAAIGWKQSLEFIAFSRRMAEGEPGLLSGFDLARGNAMARINAALRSLFYMFFAGGR